MSFASLVKDDLARIQSQKKCCRLAEFAALLRMNGNIHIGANQAISLSLVTEHAATARKIFSLAKELFDVDVEIVVYRKRRLKKNQVFSLQIPPQPQIREVLKWMGMMGEDEIWQQDFPGDMKKDILAKPCCRRAYLRGSFLGGGSINKPEGAYHLEIRCNNGKQALLLQQLMKKLNISAKIMQRKNMTIIYLKESDQIADFLILIGSHRSLLEFENVRIIKDMRNQVNRLVNCENANLNKTVLASSNQVEDIQLIEKCLGLNRLPPSLKEVALLRLSYPDSSLSELAHEIDLGRSGISHRLRRLAEIADEIRDIKERNE